METETERKITAKLIQLEAEIATLRDGYLAVNKRYSEALLSMKQLTDFSLEAALRAASAAEKCALACKNAASAAIRAAEASVIEAVNSAVEAASLAAIAAAESAAAASAADRHAPCSATTPRP